jgi:hypothetical protein
VADEPDPGEAGTDEAVVEPVPAAGAEPGADAAEASSRD